MCAWKAKDTYPDMLDVHLHLAWHDVPIWLMIETTNQRKYCCLHLQSHPGGLFRTALKSKSAHESCWQVELERFLDFYAFFVMLVLNAHADGWGFSFLLSPDGGWVSMRRPEVFAAISYSSPATTPSPAIYRFAQACACASGNPTLHHRAHPEAIITKQIPCEQGVFIQLSFPNFACGLIAWPEKEFAGIP